VAAGDAAEPGCGLDEAEANGRAAAVARCPRPSHVAALPGAPLAGTVCLCEDVVVGDLEHAWSEGYRSTEILKRYTTATMGPWQGAMCQRHLRAFVRARSGATGPADSATTARPPARGITVVQAAAGLHGVPLQRTTLQSRHESLGALISPAGPWLRPEH